MSCPLFWGIITPPLPLNHGNVLVTLKLIMKHPKKSSPEARLQTLPPWSCTWNHTPRVLELCFSPSAKTHMLHGICSHRHFSGTGWWVHQVIVSSPWIVYWPRQLHRNGKSDAENKNIWRNPPFWKQKICYKSSETEYGFFMGMFSQLNLHTFIFVRLSGKVTTRGAVVLQWPLATRPRRPNGWWGLRCSSGSSTKPTKNIKVPGQCRECHVSNIFKYGTWYRPPPKKKATLAKLPVLT